MVIAPRSVHVDADGVECQESDPRVATMIVAKGCLIDEVTALRYDLLPVEPACEPAPGAAMPAVPAKPAKAPKPAKKES